MLTRRLASLSPLALLAGLLFTASIAQAAAPKVLMVAAASSSPPDVKAKLMSTGAFASIDYFDASSKAPTLTDLAPYDVVAVWSYVDFFDAAKTGDALADYLEHGGGVVLFDYMTEDTGFGSTAIKGRYQNTYALMTSQDDSAIPVTPVTLGSVMSGHPIVAGVSTFKCGDSANFIDCHHLSSATQHGAKVVATYSDGTPLALAATINGHNVAELNFFPASTDLGFEGEWDPKTNGATLMKNALLYVLGGAIRADKGSLDFGTTGLQTATAPQTVTYTNTSMMTQTLSSIVVAGTNPGDFQFTTTTALPVTLAPGATLQAQVVFNPQDVGMRSGTLSAQVMGQMGTLDVTMTGNSVGPILTVTPSTMPIDLGGVPLNQTATGKFTVANTGGGIANISSIVVTTDAGSFGVMPQTAVPLSLAPGASVDVAVTFQSATPGRHMGAVTIHSQLPDKIVALTAATGDPMVTLGNFSVAFGPQHVGASSPPTTLSVKNTGFSNLVVSSINVSGAQASDFTITAKLPMTIPSGGTGTYQLAFKPSAVATSTAKVTVTTNDPAMNMVSYTVSGTGYSFMESLSTTMLDFGNVKGGMSATKTVNVQNTSGAPLQVTSLMITGAQASEFSLVGGPTALTIAPMDAVTLTVKFTPTTAGAAAATLAITLDDPNMPQMMVALTGTATAGKLSFTPMMVDFGSTVVGLPSMQQAVTLSNGGTDVLTLSTLSIGGANPSDYLSTDMPQAPVMIPAGQSVTFHLTFEPQQGGASTAVINITSDDPMLQSAMITLKGVGSQPMMVINPLSIDFGVIPVSASSMDKTVTVQNTGDADLKIISIQAGDAQQFIVDRPNGFTVAPGMSTTFNVHFTPKMAGPASTDLTILPQSGALMPGDVMLTGNGASAMVGVAPTMLQFATTTVGKTSDPQTVTITNKSSAPITIGSLMSTSGAFVVMGPTTPFDIQPNATATFTVAFKPSVDGTVSASVLVLLAGGNTPIATVGVSGQGLLVMNKMGGGGCSIAPSRSTQAAPLALLGVAVVGLLVRRRRRR